MFSGWRFNKEINAGELLTIISMVVGLVVFVSTILLSYDGRIEKNTFINEQQTIQIQDISKQMEENRKEQKDDMNRLSDQLQDIKNLLIQNRNK